MNFESGKCNNLAYKPCENEKEFNVPVERGCPFCELFTRI